LGARRQVLEGFEVLVGLGEFNVGVVLVEADGPVNGDARGQAYDLDADLGDLVEDDTARGGVGPCDFRAGVPGWNFTRIWSGTKGGPSG
jgi:hypothetical protein